MLTPPSTYMVSPVMRLAYGVERLSTSEADVHDVDKFSHGGTPSHFIEQQVEVLQAGSCAGL